ncbi:MAG: hypothetical protein HeimC3_30510 [Candidatus Heimdallarchaeota archaeon LC_3]|nr:MAG: hypothetical protein HeimC3_30510 [Candidatus Heimdallarchaeota archaeon LC_3]
MSIILNIINYFWKIGFNEELPDIYVKKYTGDHKIAINMIKEIMDYGKNIIVIDTKLTLFSQRNFVIMESIDRFLNKGYFPRAIYIGESNSYDFAVKNIDNSFFMAIKCKIWEEEYDNEISFLKSNKNHLRTFFGKNEKINHFCIYTSRLKAGLIEHRYLIFTRKDIEDGNNNFLSYNRGLFEDKITPYNPQLNSKFNIENLITKEIGNFSIRDGILVNYSGNNKVVNIPEEVKRIQNSVFWYRSFIEKIIIPDTVVSLGGDTFYSCANLKQLTIPKNVEIIGDNPFSNCPQLELKNESPYFHFQDGALYNRDKTRLIHYSIKYPNISFTIPDGVISIGKHTFYNCKNLENIIIPLSVKIIENNPFSNCPKLKISNNSPHFIFKDGAIYNKTMSTLFYYELSNTSPTLEIPDGVKIIGRHSFFNCNNLYSLTIPESVKIIGYNPFTNCPNLTIHNKSLEYCYEEGALLNKEKNELIHYSIPNQVTKFEIPKTVTKIGRSAFYGCINLNKVIIPDNVEIIERSAFANCINLEEIELTNNITSMGDWAFYNCERLKTIKIPKMIEMGSDVFLNSPIDNKT